MTIKTLLLLSALSLSVSAWADHKHDHKSDDKKAAASTSESATVTGEVLDLSCFLTHGGTGKDHKKCAQTCLLEKNAAAGLLLPDGSVYVLLADHEHAKEYAAIAKLGGEKAKVTGKKSSKGGLQAILIEKVEKA
jgi:hypothetical protein